MVFVTNIQANISSLFTKAIMKSYILHIVSYMHVVLESLYGRFVIFI